MRTKLDKARNIGNAMRVVVTVLGIIVAAIASGIVLKTATDGAWLASLFHQRFGVYAPVSISPMQAGLFIVLVVMETGAILVALILLARVFGQISASGGVDYGTAIFVRRSGIWFGVAALLFFLSTPLSSLIASIGQPDRWRFLSIELESHQLLALLLSAVLVTLGHVLALAAEIAEDNKQIV